METIKPMKELLIQVYHLRNCKELVITPVDENNQVILYWLLVNAQEMLELSMFLIIVNHYNLANLNPRIA